MTVSIISVTWWLRPKVTLSADPVGVLHQEIAEIASDVSQLEKTVAIASSSAAQEVIIRDELLLAKEGEIIVQLPPLATPVPVVIPVVTPVPIWRQWLEIFLR